MAAACGSLKGGRADWLVEKCVELGAAAFVPLLTERSPVIGSAGGSGGGSGDASGKPGSKKGGRGKRAAAAAGRDEEGWPGGGGEAGREGRWQRLATAALKQSLRAHSMEVEAPQGIEVRGVCAGIRQGALELQPIVGDVGTNSAGGLSTVRLASWLLGGTKRQGAGPVEHAAGAAQRPWSALPLLASTPAPCWRRRFATAWRKLTQHWWGWQGGRRSTRLRLPSQARGAAR